MSSLRDLQLRMARDLMQPTGTASYNYIRSNGVSPYRRVSIYRNNRNANFTLALQACYPVVERLVGTAFFAHVAKAYTQSTPSKSANLHDYGAEFAAYLQAFPALVHLPYIAEVARLEWACQEVYHASDSTIFDVHKLRLVAPEAYGALRWELHPSVRLLQSPYPILHIWQVNQPDYTGEASVDLDEGRVRLIVSRRSGIPEISSLRVGEFAFLEALAQGQSLSAAQVLASREQLDFDLDSILIKHITINTLVGCSVISSPPLNQENNHGY